MQSVASFGAVHYANNLAETETNLLLEEAFRNAEEHPFCCWACLFHWAGDRGAQIGPRVQPERRPCVLLACSQVTPSVFSYHRLLNRNAVCTAKVTGSSAFLAFPSSRHAALSVSSPKKKAFRSLPPTLPISSLFFYCYHLSSQVEVLFLVFSPHYPPPPSLERHSFCFVLSQGYNFHHTTATSAYSNWLSCCPETGTFESSVHITHSQRIRGEEPPIAVAMPSCTSSTGLVDTWDSFDQKKPTYRKNRRHSSHHSRHFSTDLLDDEILLVKVCFFSGARNIALRSVTVTYKSAGRPLPERA